MAILIETNGDLAVCDGCGRSDSGPNQPLAIDVYAVHDPNIGFPVQHHYCIGCAANRGLREPAMTIAGWTAAAPTLPAETEPTPEQ